MPQQPAASRPGAVAQCLIPRLWRAGRTHRHPQVSAAAHSPQKTSSEKDCFFVFKPQHHREAS